MIFKRKVKKEYIIPIFVPNLGCPNDCTFCNQKKISGKSTNVSAKDVKKTVDFYLKNFKDDKKYVEIAFFGGSFTGIDLEIQNELLEAANDYIKAGKVGSIRISTRPDYIDKKTLRRLKKYHVKTIELGVQSSNNEVLKASKRNHTFEDVVKASKMIRRKRFILGHQMMVGMPESTVKDEVKTAEDLIKLKPKMVRIYPVLVIKGTELARQYSKGDYEALTIEQAVERSKEIYYMFKRNNIEVIRIGLQPSGEIMEPGKNGSSVFAGPFHPAFRQLVESSMWYDSIEERIKEINNKTKKIEIRVNPEDVNNVIGNKKENILKLKKNYEIDTIIKADEEVPQGDFEIKEIE